MTLDVIGCCAFGLDIDTVQNPDHIFLEKVRAIIGGSVNIQGGRFRFLSFASKYNSFSVSQIYLSKI